MNRYALITAILLTVSTTASFDVAAAPPSVRQRLIESGRYRYTAKPAPPIIGTTKDGAHVRGGDRIILVATEFRGEFTYSKAESTFLAAYNALKRDNKSVSIGRYNRRLASDRHVVYGWYNVDRDEYGLIAFHILSNGRSAQIIDTQGASDVINDWHYESWNTNGYNVTIQIADDDAGGVAAIFHAIK
jgi:hypothetical protein